MSLLILIPLFFALYFFIFRWAILKFDIPTPGRRDSTFKLASKKEIKEKQKGQTAQASGAAMSKDEILAMEIIENLGGAQNIAGVENCATRLRVTVEDAGKISGDDVWTELGAMGVVRNNNNVQIIFGPKVISIASDVKKRLGL